jgi:1-acyl-sn-glycerol-3-phosphate acyltransferase
MRKIPGYILTPIFYICFGILLLVFHPIQWLCLKIGGYSLHKKSVDILNWILFKSYLILGNRVRFINKHTIPTNRPIIFVSNHQSMYDIPPLIYHLRKNHAKFISKIELTKGIPSISFNLKYGGAANIDRKDSKQALAEISKLAKNMQEKNWSCIIFPEGTRTKTGQMKPFGIGGLATLFNEVPNALIVPIAISGSFNVVKYGSFPLNTFLKMSWEVLKPIEPKGKTVEDLIQELENEIKAHVVEYKY